VHSFFILGEYVRQTNGKLDTLDRVRTGRVGRQKEHATLGVACSLGVVSIWPPSEDSRRSDVQLAANKSA